jgi:hypothetical protein
MFRRTFLARSSRSFNREDVLSSSLSNKVIWAEETGDRASLELGLENARLFARGDAEDRLIPREPADGDAAVTKLFLRSVMCLNTGQSRGRGENIGRTTEQDLNCRKSSLR